MVHLIVLLLELQRQELLIFNQLEFLKQVMLEIHLNLKFMSSGQYHSFTLKDNFVLSL